MKIVLIIAGMILFPFWAAYHGFRMLRVVHGVTHVTDRYPLGAAN